MARVEPTKKNWPECKGMTLEEANATIKKDCPLAFLEIYRVDTEEEVRQIFMTQGLRLYRIRVFVVAGKVYKLDELEWI